MIIANEYYLIEKLKELGIEDKKIKKIIESFEGWRIYFRKKQNEYERIKDLYKQMKKAGVSKADAVRRLSDMFEKSESRIRVIIAEQENLL